MNNINVIRKPPSREGAANPMYGKRHSIESKQKMSDAAKLRNKMYKEALKNQHHVSMDELLSNTSVKESISRIIREEIDKYLWKIQH